MSDVALYLGIVMGFVGFALMVPRGGGPGSTAHRNIAMGSQFFTTRGYHRQSEERDVRQSRTLRIVGVVMFCIGVLLISLGS